VTDTLPRVEAALACWDAGDVDGFLAAFHDDASFYVPGATWLSGDHDKQAARPVLAALMDPAS
jgi:ketosteroid isomerase-like protein